MKERMYIVEYYGGDYDDYYTQNVFVTCDKGIAEKYVEKFTKVLDKFKEFDRQRYPKGFDGIFDEKEKYSNYYDHDQLRNIHFATIKEIEIR